MEPGWHEDILKHHVHFLLSYHKILLFSAYYDSQLFHPLVEEMTSDGHYYANTYTS